MKRVRLFHFDIPTWGNYGDKVLYPVIRDLFHGYGEGEAFRFVGSAPLRKEVGLDLVDHINACADAVVVGGGGLFLQDTNPNRNSGWQWNISREALDRLRVPIVVFAVGNNRFPGQPDFDDRLIEHASAVKERAVFFGLRNTGSIESMGRLLPGGAEGIAYQPCPTTLESRIYRDLEGVRPPETRALAVQMLVHRRQQDAGFDAEAIHAATLDAALRLHEDGWDVWNTPFHPDDRQFSDALAARLPADRTRPLYGYDIDYREGIELFSRIPFVLGARGHAQMIPFGVGSVPLSLDLHAKLGFFAADIGHPELVLDPQAPDLADRIVAAVEGAWEERAALRSDIDAQQDRMWETTLGNLARIHSVLDGGTADPLPFRPVAAEHTDVESFHVRSAGGAEEDRVSADRTTRATERTLRRQLRELEERVGRAERERDEARTSADSAEERLRTVGTELADSRSAHDSTRAELSALRSRGYGEEAAALGRRTVHAARWRLRRVGRTLGAARPGRARDETRTEDPDHRGGPGEERSG